LNPSQLQSNEVFDEKIYQIPSFIESLAYVCSQIQENLPDSSLNTLEKLTMLAIDSYPKLIKRYNYQISLSVAHLFTSVQLSKFKNHSDFISRIVYQSIMRTFTYKTSYFSQQYDPYDLSQKLTKEMSAIPSEESTSTTANMSKNPYDITSKDFVMFWSNLLSLNDFKELEIDINDRNRLIGIIYDEFIETIIKIMNKLELTTMRKDGTEDDNSFSADRPPNNNEVGVSSDPFAGLVAVRPLDFAIFVNLVDFTRYLLDSFEHFFSQIKVLK
jgi:hypothetical protein